MKPIRLKIEHPSLGGDEVIIDLDPSGRPRLVRADRALLEADDNEVVAGVHLTVEHVE